MSNERNYQREYLITAAEQMEKLQNLIVKDKHSRDDLGEIFRIIHSMKGSAATCELLVLSTMAHQFEDFIVNLEPGDFDETIKDFSFKYIDIINKTIVDYSNEENSRFDNYLNEIATVQQLQTTLKEHYAGRILIVDSSLAVATLLKKTFEDKGYDCSVAKNGMTAFNRLLTEKYDALFTSINIDFLDGVSLTTALKSTSNLNSNIPVVAISSTENISSRFPSFAIPDYVILKDHELTENLSIVIDNIFSKEKINKETEGPQKILYVEDDPKMQKLFFMSITRMPGVKVEIATDEKSAIEICESFKPDVIILDQFLGRERGDNIFFNLLKYDIPTIFLTGSESSITVEKLKPFEQFKGIITKPFRPAAIYNQICQYL